MRILIVDDEIFIVMQIVSNIDWDYLGISQIETAYSIAEAIESCEKQVPDIILCDIEMPKLTGMDFLKWLREHDIESEFIFLTCHESFEYATFAMRYNVCSYLTKPFEESNVVEAVLEAKRKLERRYHDNEKSRKYEALWIKNQPIVYQDLWYDILNTKTGIKDKQIIKDRAIAKGIDIKIDSRKILIMTGLRTSLVSEMKWNDSLYFFAFRQVATEILTDSLEYNNMLEYSEGTFFHLIIILEGNHEDISGIRKRCDEFIIACKAHLNYTPNCGISVPTNIEDLPNVKNEIDKILLNLRLNEGTVVYQGDIKEAVEINKKSIDTDQINILLENGDRMSVINNMKDILLMLGDNNLLDEKTMNTIHQDFLQTLYSYLSEHDILANQLYGNETAQLLFKQSNHSIFDMLKWVNYSVDKAIEYVEKTDKPDPIIDTVKEYIKQHYNEDIRRSDIAEMVFLTPNYFSKIFNDKTGKSISEYINDYRIKKAKEMLKDSDIYISDVATMCGFDNLSYFSTIFKKVTGQTPNEYKSHS